MNTNTSHQLGSDNNVVDGNVDQLHEESNESHESKANSSSYSNLLELLPVRLGASLDESDGVLSELLHRLHRLGYLIHDSEAS